MKNDEGQKILRYAELTLRHDRKTKLEEKISPEEEVEREQLRSSLGMTHEEIIDRAVKSLIDEQE